MIKPSLPAGTVVTLLGEDHHEPKEFHIEEVAPHLVMGISSVVDKSSKTHNLINNEDAAGIYVDENCLIAMVVDAHDGYVASHEAIKQFPSRLVSHLKTEKPIEQAYLDAILEHSAGLVGVGPKSGIIHQREGYHPIEDHSSTTFHSVLRWNSQYYAIGCGDSYTAIIQNQKMTLVEPVCPYFLGISSLREKIKEKAYDYQEILRAKTDSLDDSLRSCPEKERTALMEANWQEMRRLEEEYAAKPFPSLDWRSEHVRAVVPVHKLDVRPGDVILLCTDGLDLASYSYAGKEGPRTYFPKVFQDQASLHDGFHRIFESIQQRAIQIEKDNVAMVGIRII